MDIRGIFEHEQQSLFLIPIISHVDFNQILLRVHRQVLNQFEPKLSTLILYFIEIGQ